MQRLLTPKPVRMEIFDLSGRQVYQVERELLSGGYSELWDGRGNDGVVVSPGLYILQISTKADDAGGPRSRIISVAY